MPDLSAIQPWMWLVLGLALVGFEIMAPGLFLFWLGLAAAITGLVALLFSLTWQAEFLIFAIAALASIAVGRNLSRRPSNSNNPFLNERGNALIGKEFTLHEPIVNGVGTVRIDDSVWRVSGQDAPRDSRVRVTGVDGAMLRVEASTKPRSLDQRA
jgi:inner membrane protein